MRMTALTKSLQRIYTAFLLLGGVVWASNLMPRFGVSLIDAEWIGVYLAVGIAAAFLQTPYGKRAGLFDIALGLIAISSWGWMSWHFQAWLVDFEGATPQKYVPGVIAIVLMMEALRKASGLPITILVWILIVYGFFGYLIPGPVQATYQAPTAFVMYLYADTNAIPGLVLVIIAGMVLAFIVFGKLMEVSGATEFFTDLAMSLMGHRRGGPAKVAVVASGLFGSISSSPVGNIMSTGVVTIPLMKKIGFKPHYAAAIEAVASTGGQIAPPVMGATAFLMAEFLRINYFDVVVAAALPALFYYICLFMQVDAVAVREGLSGVPKSQLPKLLAVLRKGWGFVLPLILLIYLLFWGGATPAFAALAASAVLLVFALFKRRMLTLREWAALIFGGGAGMIPLIMIGAGAGVVVGVMNATGLGQSLSFVLVEAGSAWGLLPMLIDHGRAVHHPRHGHADDGDLRYSGNGDRAGADQNGCHAVVSASLHFLFRRDVVSDAAGRGIELCCRRFGRSQHVAHRLGRHAAVVGVDAVAVCLGLRSGAVARRVMDCRSSSSLPRPWRRSW